MILMGGCAAVLQKDVKWPEDPGKEVSQVRIARNYYKEGNACLVERIGEKPRPTVGIGDIADRTGKLDTTEEGPGYFLSQAPVGMVINALKMLRVTIVDQTKLTRELMTWRIDKQDKKLMQRGRPKTFIVDGKEHVSDWQPLRQNKLLLADYLLIGDIASLDFQTGKMLRAGAFGGSIGGRTYAGEIAIDLWLVHNETGEIVANASISKPIAGVEGGIEMTRFFGTILAEISAGTGVREAFDKALRAGFQVAAYKLISDFYGEFGCDDKMNGVFRADDRIIEAEAPYVRFAKFAGPDNEVINLGSTAPAPQQRSPVDDTAQKALDLANRHTGQIDDLDRRVDKNTTDITGLQKRIAARVASMPRTTVVWKGGAVQWVFVPYDAGKACCPNEHELARVNTELKQGARILRVIGLSTPEEGNGVHNEDFRRTRAQRVGTMYGVSQSAIVGATDGKLRELHGKDDKLRVPGVLVEIQRKEGT
jgi:hypothetical protein